MLTYLKIGIPLLMMAALVVAGLMLKNQRLQIDDLEQKLATSQGQVELANKSIETIVNERNAALVRERNGRARERQIRKELRMTKHLCLLLLLPALTACNSFKQLVSYKEPDGAYVCADWPQRPDKHCELDGALTYCGVDVATWLETEVRVAFDDCKAVLSRIAQADGHTSR